MITKEHEYMTQARQISGFAMMTPFGKIILDPISTFNSVGEAFFFYYLLASLILMIMGCVSIQRGRDILTR